MKIFLICDCCEEIFKFLELPEGMDNDDLENLTGYKINSIIKTGNNSSEVYFSSTCDECGKDLIINSEFDDFLFVQPTLH